MKQKLFFTFLLTCLFINVFSQDTINYAHYAGKYVVIQTNEGKELKGRVLELDKTSLGLYIEKTGMVYIQLENILNISEDNKLGSGRNSKDEVYATRYIFTPSYLRLEKGDNYGRLALWGAEMDYAISKSVTLGMMMSWLGSPMAINGKFAVPISKKIHIGFGCLFGWGGILAPPATVALPFGGITFGDTKSNLTFTGGYGISSFTGGNNLSNVGTQLAFSFSGMKKMKDGATLIFESVMIPYTPGSNNITFTLTPGIRFHRKYTRSMQVGITFMIIDGVIVPSPIPAISWFFKAF